MCSEDMYLLLSGHLDGANTPEQERKLLAHLEKCEDCRRTLDEYQRIDAGIAGLEEAPPAAFTKQVMDELAVEVPKPKKQHRFPLRYGTAFAAVAAVLVLMVSTGKVSLSHSGSTAIGSDFNILETQDEEARDTADAMALPESAFRSFAAEEKSDAVHANVDCAALAQAENCSVGVIYTQEDLPILNSVPSLLLSGGVRYTITQAQLEALCLERKDLLVYQPEAALPSENEKAFLIVVRPDK